MATKESFRSSVATEFRNYISHKQALGYCFESQSMILLYLDRILIGKTFFGYHRRNVQTVVSIDGIKLLHYQT
jgi:hypothetical protein